MRADLIAAIYKLRWQIELLFYDKQLKQNFPLKYFLGDNENAIKIKIGTKHSSMRNNWLCSKGGLLS